ncbi:MAG: geranylgeranylglyceryl/heptaprenylglyceryl phosphate synthase [Bacteroidales bacterium]|jgi:phosphoglycerol geranylgeranyltransferase|nr:geranylgeranylglyceryl/heptaprenylglyceryl phosphate synthase [Bacteroidales bacterium]
MIFDDILKQTKTNKKLFALLIDPDNYSKTKLIQVIDSANQARVDLIFVGGSLLSNSIDETIKTIKDNTDIPVVLFPGNVLQISSKADAILLLSLISGRNPDLLIGNHVIAASHIKKSKLEVIPTGYILINGGKISSVEYMSNTKPIPADKTDIAVATAMAGEMLGLKTIYMEAGSGAKNSLNIEMIKKVKQNINLPLIVGGGLNTPEEIRNTVNAGADIVVIGTAIENNINILAQLVNATRIKC